MKENKGITLIALVVTIIILLILAGVTLSLVLGNQGLIGKAQFASNTMAEATRNEMRKMNEYAEEVFNQTADYIGGGSDPAPTASTVVFKNGTETVTTPQVGNDVEIGAEKFKIIKITGNKVTAMPYYNLYIAGNPATIKQATEDNYSSAGTVAFAPGSSATWGADRNIDIDDTTNYPNNVKTPIASYETYLKGLGASNVEAKIGRYYPTTQAGATITEAEYIGDVAQANLNPSGTGRFWLGSSDSDYASRVRLVSSFGDLGYGSFSNANNYGVRPVIIITIS